MHGPTAACKWELLILKRSPNKTVQVPLGSTREGGRSSSRSVSVHSGSESLLQGVIRCCLEMVLNVVLDTCIRGCGSSEQGPSSGRHEVIKPGAGLMWQEASYGVIMRTHSHLGAEEPGLG